MMCDYMYKYGKKDYVKHVYFDAIRRKHLEIVVRNYDDVFDF